MSRDYGTNKTEQAIIKSFGGKPHKNSGRGKVNKGDGTYKGFTVDVKETKSSFTMSKSVWAKVCTDSVKNNQDPMLLVVLDGGTRLAVVEFDTLDRLLDIEEQWEEDQNG